MSGASPASARDLEQVLGIGVLVRRHREREALVDGTRGEPVELDARRLEHREAGLAPRGRRSPCTRSSLSRKSCDVERRARDVGAQRLDDGVATDDELGAVLAGADRRAAARAGAGGGRLLRDGLLLLRGAHRGLVLRVLGAVDGLRRRLARLEATTALTAGADGHPLLRAFLAHGALALGVAGHQSSFPASDQRAPPLVSSTTMPAFFELVADGVGPRPVLGRTCVGPLGEQSRHEVVDGAAQGVVVGAAGVGPGLGVRVDAEDVEHRLHRRRGLRAPPSRSPAASARVALAHGVVDDGERLRHAEVVVHRGVERRRADAARTRRRRAPTSQARSRKPSIRRKLTAFSSSASNENSIIER